MFKDKNILVTGGSGLIGQELIKLLKTYNPAKITNVSLDDIDIEGVESNRLDLRNIHSAISISKDKDIIFHLAGIKSNPKNALEKPYTFSANMIMFNSNMLLAFKESRATHFLYTSSVGVYEQAPLLKEDDVWRTMPSKNDWHPGWAKRIGELQCEAFMQEFGKQISKKISIVRPTNIYGNADNYSNSGMVISSVIKRLCDGENPLVVWGDGSAVRDFCHASDVARAMIFVVENEITEPVNIGSGDGVHIKTLIDIITNEYQKITNKSIFIKWDTSKPTGDAIRVMDMSKMSGYGFSCKKSLREGINEAIQYYLNNKDNQKLRYDAFKQ